MATALRIGLMVPANNTTMETEMLEWLPEGAMCRTLRIPRQAGLLRSADIPAYVKQAESLARAFAEEPVDLVIYGCTAAGILAGPEQDAAVAESLAGIAGAPCVTTARSMVESLREADARDIALVTPYSAEVNERLKSLLARSSIAVRRMSSFEAPNVEELGRIDSEQVAARARETMGEDCDALFIACSQLPTRSVLGPLEREFGRPVWSSIKATAWRACDALGVPLRDD
jgi:maleate cis-trans isomerase